MKTHAEEILVLSPFTCLPTLFTNLLLLVKILFKISSNNLHKKLLHFTEKNVT